jgi:hypothetical protein
MLRKYDYFMADTAPAEAELLLAVEDYLDLLQQHPTAERMLSEVVTEDFETGFAGGFHWVGPDGLRDFLAARDGFFDESHEVREVLEAQQRGSDEARLKTRLEFFLRRWEAPAPRSEEFTGSAFHSWLLRRSPAEGRWRVAAQIVDGFADLNDNAARLFATPEEGLNR